VIPPKGSLQCVELLPASTADGESTADFFLAQNISVLLFATFILHVQK